MSYYQRRQQEMESSMTIYKILFYITIILNTLALAFNLVFFSWYIVIHILLYAALIIQRIFITKQYNRRIGKLVMDELRDNS